MIRCKRCAMPDTRPDHVFVDGVCPACINASKKREINWLERRQDLIDLLDRHHGEVIVPSSGGKDSTYQAITLKEMGAHVTAVTATTCHLTPIGRRNIDNLAKHVRTIEYTPNQTVRAILNRKGLELVGDISWPEHAAIFSTPFRAALDLGIPLIMYGENPQHQYGGPKGTEEARQMTQRWTQEFGGFLGLRPSDFVGMNTITAKDMMDYQIPSNLGDIEAHFLGQYIEWDSDRNAKIAVASGMEGKTPCSANWWKYENQDNAQTGIHDHMMYRKYGYGRGCSQISVDIREGRVARQYAVDWVAVADGLFPYEYAGVPIADVLDRIDMDYKRFMQILEMFTNWELFNGTIDNRPILKEHAGKAHHTDDTVAERASR